MTACGVGDSATRLGSCCWNAWHSGIPGRGFSTPSASSSTVRNVTPSASLHDAKTGADRLRLVDLGDHRFDRRLDVRNVRFARGDANHLYSHGSSPVLIELVRDWFVSSLTDAERER